LQKFYANAALSDRIIKTILKILFGEKLLHGFSSKSVKLAIGYNRLNGFSRYA